MKLTIKFTNDLPTDTFMMSGGDLLINGKNIIDGAVVEEVTFEDGETPTEVAVITDEPNIYRLKNKSKDGKTYSRQQL